MRRAGQMSSNQGRGTVITVAGAKGGIGKSVIAVNLALALRRETGRMVAIVDLDVEFGDVATMLDLSPRSNLSEALRMVGQLDRERVRDFMTTHASGLDMLAAAPEGVEWEEFKLEQLPTLVDLLAQTYDFVVIDTGPFSPVARKAVECSTLTLLITSGEVSSVRDTAAALRRLHGWGIEDDRIKLLLNRGIQVNGFQVGDVQEAVGGPIFWETPHDDHVPTSVQLGQPVSEDPKSAAGRNLVELARRIVGTRTPLFLQPERTPAWKQLLRIGG